MGGVKQNPFREWTDAAGEEWVGLHPMEHALRELYMRRTGKKANFWMLQRLRREVAQGKWQIPDEVQQKAREIDASQRANGYAGT